MRGRRGSLAAQVAAAAGAALLAGLLLAASAAASGHVFKETFRLGQSADLRKAHCAGRRQGDGDLLVADSEADTISRWKPNGEPAPFSALAGSNVIDGKRGPGNKPCAEEPASARRAPHGLEVAPFGFAREVQIAVDSSGGVTSGDIYVTEPSRHLAYVFGSDGSYLGQLTEYEESPGEPATLAPVNEICGVSVDSSGNVYLGDFSSADLVHKYHPTANPVANTDNVANFNSLVGLLQPLHLGGGEVGDGRLPVRQPLQRRTFQTRRD